MGRRLWPSGEPAGASVWIQAVSVGEVEIAASFVDALRSLRPALPLLVTSTTPAGMALLERRFRGRDGIATRPFPLDLPVSVGRFFRAVSPRLLVLVETELWPAVLLAARRRSVPVLLVNGRLSERSARRYRAARPLLRGALGALTLVAARTADDAARFVTAGVPAAKIRVVGDMKFDRPPAPEPPFAAEFRRLAAGRRTVVAGSIADDELPLVLDVRSRLASTGEDPFLLLAPRRPESFRAIERELTSHGLRVASRSALAAAPARPDVFLLDSLGELAGSYGLGDAALLGGTFAHKGGHNVLEPLRAGLPTIHGPSVANIRRTLEAAAGAVFGVDGADGAARMLRELLSDPEARKRAATVAARIFSESAGATQAAARAALDLIGTDG